MTVEIIKPSLDDRTYHSITLENNLSVLLISDPTTDKSSAALDVHVGHLSDPDTAKGLAHFCEHLLFMGTEKYPGENDYSQYLSNHNGYSNAYTSGENTNYYFQVSSDHLEGALDRFAQFFIAPLFNESGTERELLAVDSEHKKNLQSDNWRIHQLERDLSNPAHSFTKFGTGNITTLRDEPKEQGIDIRKVLLDFHSKYYSANIMKLVVLGKESIKDLEKWVKEKFKDVKDKNVAVPAWDGHPLSVGEYNKITFVKPVKDLRYLELIFPFPDTDQLYRSNPNHYLSHLIGHESGGSILSLLKKKGWALGLSAGGGNGGKGFSFFRISIDLTEEGLINYKSIITICFQYIHLLSTSPVQEWVFTEYKLQHSLDFKFKQKSDPADYCSRIAGFMHKYPTEHYLCGHYLVWDYDAGLIERFIRLLDPKKVKFTLCGPGFKGIMDEEFLKAKYYGTEYVHRDIDDELKKQLANIIPNTDLHFPKPNEFVPSNFEVVKTDAEPLTRPSIILDNDTMRLWYKKDDLFFVPKVFFWLNIRSPFAYITPLSYVQTKIYLALLKDSLVELAYYAECAGLRYDIDNTTDGLLIIVQGYNEKAQILLTRILERMVNLEIKPDRFQVIKDDVTRNFKNWGLESPHQQAMFYVNYCTQESIWHNDEKLAEIDDVTIESMNTFMKLFFGHTHCEGLIHGNLDKQQSLTVGKLIQETIKTKPLPQFSRFAVTRTHLIAPGSNIIYQSPVQNPENLNSAIEYFIQVCDYDDDLTRAKLSLFSHIASEPCFDTLRTKEQLGYMVAGVLRKQTGIWGYRVIIQSERHPVYLESRINAFFESFLILLSEMSQTEFDKFVKGLVTKLLEKYKNLNDESREYWGKISSHFYYFQEKAVDAANVAKLTKKDIIQFYHDHISFLNTRRRKISCWMTANKQHYLTKVDGKIDVQPLKSSLADDGKVVDEVLRGCEFIGSLEELAEFKYGMAVGKGSKIMNELKEMMDL